MELRIQKARTTKDLDLVIRAQLLKDNYEQDIFDRLQEAAKAECGDYFVFLIGETTLDLVAVLYGGSLFPVEVLLDGRLFVSFLMDVVISSLILESIENIVSENWLKFAGIETTQFPTISCEQQFAEKLHAYTMPRDECENSRVKNLVDMILFIRAKELKTTFLQTSVKKTFEYRNTHVLLQVLELPPANWHNTFEKLSMECGLATTLDQDFAELKMFFEKL